ncbi:MAG: glycosyltransferase [Candidatus Latescibacterota bacterium]|nr:MAG: glycosyltransferase [Candidatus Latescibacterota bacterium]
MNRSSLLGEASFQAKGASAYAKEIRITQGAILATLATAVLAGFDLLSILRERVLAEQWVAAAAQALFVLIGVGLLCGSLIYQFTRAAYFRRLLGHRSEPAEEIAARLLIRDAPPVSILIPSYKEDRRIVRQALLSAALQDYPNRRVVLLIDDPPASEDRRDLAALDDMRALVRDLQSEFARQAAPYLKGRRSFERRAALRPFDEAGERERLARLCAIAASWFRGQERRFAGEDHTDRLFVEKVLAPKREQLLRAADELRAASGSADRTAWTERRVAREYRRLAGLFDVEISSFERKRYENLSHEPNKAMNLNSYIVLLGKSLRRVVRNGKVYLETPDRLLPTHTFPDAKYVVTLDADSILLPEYVARLVSIMEQDGNERLAVIQTPYSAVPGAPGWVERIAGATTDIQYIIHQGFTHYDATYWVGANAVLRKEALDDICVLDTERGHTIARYIQDRTVIEDTESTVDLVSRGWRLHNYPERLSYSATPPDFGSLLIQRRRWANGGLIILPKLLRYWLPRAWRPRVFRSGLVRIHYLVSIAIVNVGLALAILFPFEESMRAPFLPLTAVPYFWLYARDLRRNGYRASDVFRVYALNLMLLFVNLAGVFRSLQQALADRKVPFGRTPKIQGRTSAPAFHVLAVSAITGYCLLGFVTDGISGRYAHAFFSLMNGMIFLYALRWFLGFREAIEDLLLHPAFAWAGRFFPGTLRPISAEALAGAEPAFAEGAAGTDRLSA